MLPWAYSSVLSSETESVASAAVDTLERRLCASSTPMPTPKVIEVRSLQPLNASLAKIPTLSGSTMDVNALLMNAPVMIS